MRAIMSPLITTPAVFTVHGDLAGPDVAGLAERLWPHLLTAPPETVLNLGAAATIDSAGVDLLAAAHTYAVHRGCALHIINATPRVQRALHAAGTSTGPVSTPHTESTTATAPIEAPWHPRAAVMA
ncbi:anti-anti-sigma regulatory factor [Halopolyspora algeriensis]|uniref:Anti-anti-sigma regulatory factor n=1 Tax=Halopolyspora algeriensis TaxID=1500506 RepID=A0A368VI33_9ACTN|nr:STAS domain-containing protein [Halopolyspora algeriensis]RCW40945.1 anti-anti-sigma regulatory factor [Halopolyspora algeriensis]TQM53971.1 anti-anti-sigma regulatory factor [Halopolyspora algeriensis]